MTNERKKKTALLTLTVREAWLWYGMKLFCWVSVYSEQPVVLKLWMTMGGKKNGLRQISDFYRKQTKKVHSYFVSLQRCIQLKFKFISPSHPIPGLLHYSHESSLKSFSFPPTSQHHLHHPLSNRSAIVPPERVQTISSSALNLLSPSCPSVALFSIVVPPSADRQ